ncbi:hypothetical protein SAMN00017405_1116 [Desulfonispora thiosulfatigenes DSM 11270]|uniref:DUF5673 domain-containing protein n=1 Tax=Desulfonispora thiosulfatigenes DSM 11270 TaxID=656914 RepID=A0A1W1UYM7_DESTI|nr:hypothetical protein [Desulfonispora thiosulfatigenes]SMB86100.1 hypothetical protein SAMN00017405_1116 [Desulfonispora thiosulfatigenes DSM 11270]
MMTYILFSILNIGLILFVLIKIYKDKKIRRQGKDKIIIELNKNLNSMIASLIWFVTFIILLRIFIIKTNEVYHLLHQDYINSIFQLFNLEYLEHLRKYFLDNNMTRELVTIVSYKSNILSTLTLIIVSFCSLILESYLGWQRNIVYEHGILFKSETISWNDIVDYQWSKVYKNNLLKKGVQYDLNISLQKVRFFYFNNEVKFIVNYEDKELVNRVLKECVINGDT